MVGALLIVVSCVAGRPVAIAPTPLPARVDLLAASLPGVALVVRQNADETIGFGSGVWLQDGTVLTNLHVVDGGEQLGVMAFRADRPSYIPTDGGLSRYLFENQSELYRAILLRGDPVLDLALVRVEGLDPPAVLPWRSDTVAPGESVLVLGHPNQVVWSFTAGVVSAIHQGAIQTDASINRGNSGGPLLDERGRVVGVNTTKLFGESEGIAFARPADLVREFVDASTAPVAMDRSTPQAAWTSCQRAFELGLPGQRECVAWESIQLQARLALAARLEEPAWRARYPEVDPMTMVPEDWLTAAFEDALNGGYRELTAMLGGWTPPATLTLWNMEAAPRVDSEGRTVATADDVLQRLRMGQRIDDFAAVDDTRVWLRIVGRAANGASYTYSRCLRQRDGAWSIDPAPSAEAIDALPDGWPPPLATAADFFEVFRSGWADGSLGDQPILGLVIGSHWFIL